VTTTREREDPAKAPAPAKAAEARERAVAGGEKVGLARVQATGPGDTQTGEREDAVSRREEEVLLREGWVRAREEAAVAKAERQVPLEQMKEANEELTLVSIRAQELAEEAEEARHRLEVSERELRRAVEVRERLIATVSHDLRNPLGTILMAIEILESGDHLDATGAKIAGGIRRSVDRMNKMIAQLLDFTRAHSGAGLPVERRPMNLQDVCRQVVEELELQHSMPGRFRCEFHGNLNGAWDASRLAQLVSNLGGNAIEHGAPDTPIDIRVHDEGEEVLLEMHNQGPPITLELLPFVFAPFRQASGQKGAKSGGLGLGLYISDRIVRGHGGSIVALSTAAEGTTFSVRLPRRPAETAQGAITEDDDSGKLILLVDDDPEWTQLLGMLLQAKGFQVSVAVNGQEALDLMARVLPSVALVDLNMPIMDGRELLQRLAIDPAFAKVPIALITSGSKPPAGYVVFRKPLFDLDALLTFVRQAVARAR
jgi:signal transduction histidine kinase/CheY-like chemotaxis protein